MTVLNKTISTLLAIALSGCAFATEESPNRMLRADELLKTIIERDGGPGVSAAVVQDGKILWSGATGFSDLEAHIALTVDTRMRIGSVSKPITAAVLLRLWDQGLIDLDADVRDLVPDLGSSQEHIITARMLAGHTSGIRQYDFSDYLDANNVYYYPSLTGAFAKVASDPLLSEPGSVFHYSSIGYNVLGIAAERASELSFSDVTTRELTTPLGLKNTLVDHPLEIISNRTRFYTRFPDGVVRNTIWRDSSDFYPSGGMLSTAEDLARLTSAVFGGEWLSSMAMELLTTEATTTSGDPTGYTFGWQIVRGEDGAVRYFEHGGETNGAHAFVRYFPLEKLAVAGIVNSNFAVGEPYFFEAISEHLPALFGIRER